MSKKIKLTPVEWEIMNAIWDLGGEKSVREILEYAFPDGKKAYTTVQAFMYILERKKLLRCRKIGLVNFYTPIRTRDEVVRAEMSSLLARVFDGSVTDLANSLLSLENVSLDEIQNIKKLLHQKEKELQKIKS